jgi:copper resistance protein B
MKMMRPFTSLQAASLMAALTPILFVTGPVNAQTSVHSQHPPSATSQPHTNPPLAQPTAPSDPHAAHQSRPDSDSASEDHDAEMEHPSTPAPSDAVDHAAMGHGAVAAAATGQSVDHAAMGHGASMPAEPRTPIPPVSDADRAAAVRPDGGHPAHDNTVQHYVLFNRLEAWDADPGTGMAWEGQAWVGTDLNRLWLRSEGERSDGHTEAADLEVLYGRSIATWWDLVAGVRHDFQPGDGQTFAAIGVQGLAPMKFEVEATAYIGERGQTAARVEAEYELLLTNRLVLQPLVEVNLFGKDDPERGIGSGLSTAEAGLRLRYELTRQFAPYVGVVYERAFGSTADLRRDEFERVEDTRVVVGVRAWF